MTRFQMPGGNTPGRITGDVEVEVQRENHAVITGPHVNGVGRPEYVVRAPVVPAKHLATGQPDNSVLLVPGFIEPSDVCF